MRSCYYITSLYLLFLFSCHTTILSLIDYQHCYSRHIKMRSSTYITILAGTAAAQESAILFNPFQFGSTMTVIGSDESATTYRNSCPSGAAGLSAIPTELRM